MSWQEFQSHLKHSKRSKAGGPDKTNNYILALCPEPIQRLLHSILNRFLYSPLPPRWLRAKICLLYTNGDPFSPSNYRPIALLNCIYKLLATFAGKHLRSQVFAHDIPSEIQHGSLPGHQCAGHLYHFKVLFAKSKQSSSLFLNFNNAFNSVPHGTLWTVLERAKFPTSTISFKKPLYSFPQDNPYNQRPHPYCLPSNQGPPARMSPSSPTFHPLPQLPLPLFFCHGCPPRTEARTGDHAYIDEILIKSEDVVCIQNSLNYFDGPARTWRLDMNVSKTEVHANGTAPEKEFLTPRGSELLT